MEKNDIKHILCAPLSFVRRCTEEEKKIFSDQQEGWFFTFGLASEQVFVGHISQKEQSYVFRPLTGPIWDLQEIHWKRKGRVEDLGYTTACQMREGVDKEKKDLYEEILAPKPEKSDRFPVTKVAFKYYSYHPLLEKAYYLQMALWECVRAKRALLDSQKHVENLLVSQKQNNIVQQKLNKRRQNG